MESLMSERKAMSLKRSRVKYTQRQTEKLERLFEHNQYPDSDIQEKLAAEIGVSTERIAIWFQNRRSKFKRQCHSNHVTWMRRQIFLSSENPTCIFGTPPHLGRPACHVLSPLESQVLRDDTITMSSPGFKSPCGISPYTRLRGTPNLTPEVLQGQNSCSLDVSNHTSSSSIKAANLTQPIQNTDFCLLDAISRIPQEPSFEGIQSPESIMQKCAPQSALSSSILNDRITVTDTTPVSCGSRTQSRYANQQQEAHSYIDDKENIIPGRLLEHAAQRFSFSERLYDLSECYTPMDLRLSKSSHVSAHETSVCDSFIGPNTGYQGQTDAMQTYEGPADFNSSNILEDWI